MMGHVTCHESWEGASCHGRRVKEGKECDRFLLSLKVSGSVREDIKSVDVHIIGS